MSIRRRLKALEARFTPPKSYDAEIARLFERLPKDADGNVLRPRNDAEFRMLTRLKIMMAGLPPADSYDELSRDDLHRVLEYHNDDAEGEILGLPVFSWRMVPENLRECHRLEGCRNRGEITPEEYRRRVRELAGLPSEEAPEEAREESLPNEPPPETPPQGG
jgi:hypothetical protein